MPQAPDILAPWNQTVANNEHNVRVRCDILGLNLAAKNLITCLICIESNFQCYYLEDDGVHKKGDPVKNENMVNGKLGSTDWGIVQVNDRLHIGPGKDFSSVQYVLSNPQADIDWMIQMYKAGLIRLWSSYHNIKAGKYPEIVKKYKVDITKI